MALLKDENDALLLGVAVAESQQAEQRRVEEAQDVTYRAVAADLAQRDVLLIALSRVQDELTVLSGKARALGLTRRLRNAMGNLENWGARLRNRIKELGVRIAIEDSHAPHPVAIRRDDIEVDH